MMIYKISTLFDWLIPTIPNFENFDCQEGGQAELQGRGGQLLAHEELLRLRPRAPLVYLPPDFSRDGLLCRLLERPRRWRSCGLA